MGTLSDSRAVASMASAHTALRFTAAKKAEGPAYLRRWAVIAWVCHGAKGEAP
jgi:hypothetical protein